MNSINKTELDISSLIEIIEFVNQGIYIINVEKQKFEYTNEAANIKYGNSLKGRELNCLLPEKSKKYIKEILNSLSEKKKKTIDSRFMDENGQEYPVKLKFKLLKSSELSTTNALIISEDLSKLIDERQKRQVIETAIESTVSSVFTSDLEGKIIFANKSAAVNWGYQSVEEMLNEKPYIFDYWTNRTIDFAYKIFIRLLKKGLYHGEGPVGERKNGEEFKVEVLANVVKNSKDQVIGVTASFIDLSHEVQTKDILERALKQKDVINQLNNIAIAKVDSLTFIQELNRILKQYFKHNTRVFYKYVQYKHQLQGVSNSVLGNIIEKSILQESAVERTLLSGNFLIINDQNEFRQELELLFPSKKLKLPIPNNELKSLAIVPLRVNEYVRFILLIPSKIEFHDNDLVDLQSVIDHANKLFTNLELEREYYNSTIRLNSSLKVKNKLVRLNKENEILLKEIHHRVKNNLQIITSLLALQGDYIESKDPEEVLRASRLRVSSMSLVHEMLYQTEDFQNLDYSKYLKELIDSLSHSFGVASQKIEFKISVDDINLSLDTSIPLGLLITEIVTNSMKYAFREEKGSISLDLRKANDQFYILNISDDGIGFDYETVEKSLGLKLIESLVRQLKGSYELHTKNGTAYNITFKEV